MATPEITIDTQPLANAAPTYSLRVLPLLHIVLYSLIILGCVLRIYNVIAHNPMGHLWSDPLRHWTHASEPLTPSPMALFDPPVYQIWLSFLQRITMGIPGLIAAFVIALSLITPWCWYRFLREAIASRTVALSGWAAFSLLPTWIGIFSYFMTETLLLPLIGLSLWMTLRAQRRPTLQTFLLMVAVWITTGLTRGVTIPLAGIACALVWLRHPNKLSTAIISAFILTTVLTPLAIRNHHFIHLWAPHGNGWLTRIYAESGRREILLKMKRDGAKWNYGFTSPMMDEQPFAPLSDWKTSRTGTVNVSVDFNLGAQDWEAALKQNIQSGAARWKLHAENIVYLFQGNSWPDNNQAYFMGWLANLSRWLWIPLFLCIVSVSIWQWRVCRKKPLLPLLIITWFFFQAWLLISVNEGRYRKPVEGLLIAQACVLADACRRNKRKDYMEMISEPNRNISSPLQPRPAPALVSFVLPVYNEIEMLPHLRVALEAWLKDMPHAAEIILVDDGSRDGSFVFIQEWADCDQRVRGLSFSKNFGHQIAVSAGLAVAQGDAVVIMDADLQDPLDVVTEMLARYMEGYDVVYGQRKEREGETVFKRCTAWLFYRLMRRFVHPDLPEDAGDFRLVSRRCLDVILRMNEQHRFLRGLFAWVGFHQIAVRYNRSARKYGQTKYPLLKMVKLAWNAALSFSTLPIKLITAGGFATAALAFAYGIYAVMQKYMFHNTVQGWTGLVVIVGLIGGMILVSLGVIGEYVGRIFEEIKHRPLYIVQQDTWANKS